MEVLRDRIVRGRKEYICEWCINPIQKGTHHNAQTNVHEGSIYTYRVHAHCMEIANKLNMFEDVDEGVSDSFFQEYIHEEYKTLMGDEDVVKSTFEYKLSYVLYYYNLISVFL